MKPKTDRIEKRQAPRNDADRMLSNLSPTETAPHTADVMLHASRKRMEIGHQLPRIGPHSEEALIYAEGTSCVQKLRKHAA